MLLRDVTRVVFFSFLFLEQYTQVGWGFYALRCYLDVPLWKSFHLVQWLRIAGLLFLSELMRWPTSSHQLVLFLLHVLSDAAKPTRPHAHLPPTAPHPPPSSTNRERTFIKLTLQIHRPPRALSWETQGSYIELHEEHNTSTNAQCK